jgi:hypothetical protein
MLVFKVTKVHIILFAVILLLIIACATAIFHFYKNAVTPNLVLSAIYNQNTPCLELATRVIKWQVVISKKVKFPAQNFTLAKTCTLKAGFDLKKLTPENIFIDSSSQTIFLTLPQPEIISISWSNLRVIEEKTSIAHAIMNKAGFQEKERQKSFNQALLDDIKREKLLSFEDLSEGINTFFGPIVNSYNYKLVLKKPSMPNFHILCQKFIQENNI